MIALAGRGSLRLVPFPAERKKIDIGDFYADTSLVRATLGWEPRVSLREGLAKTLAFYHDHKERYL
jgi:UDP-glucose 4-epimerase